MATVTVPTRAPSDLGAALSNTRTPAANELSAVNMEKIKDHLIAFANAINSNSILTPLNIADISTNAITIRTLSDGVTRLAINAQGLVGQNQIIIQPDTQATATFPGWPIILAAGVGGATDQNGGDVEIDGGLKGGNGIDGQAKIATKRGNVTSGVVANTTQWTHRGDLIVNNAPTAIGHVTRKDYVDAQRPTVTTLAGTSATMASADSGKLVRCTAATTVTITVPTGLTVGTTVEYLQEGAGQIQVVAGGGMTLRHSATFNPHTATQWSSLVVTITLNAEALVRGDLDAV